MCLQVNTDKWLSKHSESESDGVAVLSAAQTDEVNSQIRHLLMEDHQ